MTSNTPTPLKKPICYFDGVTEVHLGDMISAPVWFLWKKTGRVVYVPGISLMHPEFEHHNLMWVGVKCEDGMLFGEVVDPRTGCLLKRVHFGSRNASTCDLVHCKITSFA